MRNSSGGTGEYASNLQLWAAGTHDTLTLLLLVQLRRLQALPAPSFDLLSVGAERIGKPSEKSSLIRPFCNVK